MQQLELHADDYRHCRQVLRRGSKTFFMASTLLPRETRVAATVYYAFCRVSDDAVDEPSSDPAAALRMLDRRAAKIYSKESLSDPIDRALRSVASRYSLPSDSIQALLEGYAWDVAGRSYDTLEQLEGYAARVAGSVGFAMAHFMGATSPESLSRASDLGSAMQLTNIARDVAEDARRDRVYLPLEWLDEAELKPRDIITASRLGMSERRGKQIATVVRRVLDRAEELYLRADQGIASLSPRNRWAIRAARLLYAEIGREIERKDCDILSGRAAVSWPRKLRLLVRAIS